MPTYEYVCKDCGEGLEVVQSFHDDALTVCPACNGALRKVFSAAGIIFKGSGWHIKDYASSRNPSGDTGSTTAGSGDGDSSSKDSSSKDSSSKQSSSKDSSSGDSSGSSSSSTSTSDTSSSSSAATD